MRNEFNNAVKAYQGGEDYSETICFNFNKQDQEFENSTDLYVTEELIDFDREDLTSIQIDQVYAFAELVQQEIREAIQYGRDIQDTEDFLRYNFS